MPKATHGGASNSWESPDLGEPAPTAPITPITVDIQLPEISEVTPEVETPTEEVSAEELDEPMTHFEAEPDAIPETATDSSGNEEVMESAGEEAAEEEVDTVEE